MSETATKTWIGRIAERIADHIDDQLDTHPLARAAQTIDVINRHAVGLTWLEMQSLYGELIKLREADRERAAIAAFVECNEGKTEADYKLLPEDDKQQWLEDGERAGL